MRYFFEDYDTGFYTKYGYFGGMCCGAYQANTVEEFRNAHGGLVVFTDKEKYPNFSEDGEYLCHTIEHDGNHIHLKILVVPKENKYYNLGVYKEKRVDQEKYPYTSIYLTHYLALSAVHRARTAKTYLEKITTPEGVVAYIYTPEMERDWEVRSFLDDLEKNSELLYESPWFFNHNYLGRDEEDDDTYEPVPRLKLMIYDRKS